MVYLEARYGCGFLRCSKKIIHPRLRYIARWFSMCTVSVTISSAVGYERWYSVRCVLCDVTMLTLHSFPWSHKGTASQTSYGPSCSPWRSWSKTPSCKLMALFSSLTGATSPSSRPPNSPPTSLNWPSRGCRWDRNVHALCHVPVIFVTVACLTGWHAYSEWVPSGM